MTTRVGAVLLAVLMACNEAGQRRDSAIATVTADSTKGQRVADTTVIVVRRPTLVAFYPERDSSSADTSGAAAAAGDDFSYHLSVATRGLDSLGFTVVMRPVDSVRIAVDGRVTDFRPPRDKPSLGFYFVAPSRPPLVLYGVHTYVDLVETARRFLTNAAKR